MKEDVSTKGPKISNKFKVADDPLLKVETVNNGDVSIKKSNNDESVSPKKRSVNRVKCLKCKKILQGYASYFHHKVFFLSRSHHYFWFTYNFFNGV